MTQTVHFSIGDITGYLHDMRWNFREDPKGIYEKFKELFKGIPHEILDDFFRGRRDATMDGDAVVFVPTTIDKTNETIDWVELQYVKSGEAIEIYFEGMTHPEKFHNRSDFKYTDDYEEAIQDEIDLYRGHYDRETKTFAQWKKTLNWFLSNWTNGERKTPTLRVYKDILNATKLDELRCNQYWWKSVNRHALILDGEGQIWWFGVNYQYNILQHTALEEQLDDFGVEIKSYYGDGGVGSNIAYDPVNGWRTHASTINQKQLDTLIAFAIERNEDFLIMNEKKNPIEVLIEKFNRYNQ